MSDYRRKAIERQKIANGYFDNEIALANEAQRAIANDGTDFTNSFIIIGLRMQRDKIEAQQKKDTDNHTAYTGILTLLDMAINRLERITTYD